MSESDYERLEDVVLDDAFPDVDLALRRGRHIDRDDAEWYPFLVDAEAHLVEFYRRFGCELLHRSDGYFFLLPTSDRLGRRQLSMAEMLVGQALTLLYLDPATVQQSGTVTRDQLLAQLASTLGTEALVRALNPKRRRYDERVAQETARLKIGEAVRRLAALGFLDLVDGERLRLRPALLRFAEPVRGTAEPSEALERLVAAGEVALDTVEAEELDDAGERLGEEDASGAVMDDDAAAEAPYPEADEVPYVPDAAAFDELLGDGFEDVARGDDEG
jgi:chromosome partition protein MukE